MWSIKSNQLNVSTYKICTGMKSFESADHAPASEARTSNGLKNQKNVTYKRTDHAPATEARTSCGL